MLFRNVFQVLTKTWIHYFVLVQLNYIRLKEARTGVVFSLCSIEVFEKSMNDYCVVIG
jgi:hypothetical protein